MNAKTDIGVMHKSRNPEDCWLSAEAMEKGRMLPSVSEGVKGKIQT